MRYLVRAHVYDVLRCAVALEIDAETEELARSEALAKLRAQYPDSATISVSAKAVYEPA